LEALLAKIAGVSTFFQKSYKLLKTSQIFAAIMNSKNRIIGKETQAFFSFWHFRNELKKTFLYTPPPLSWWQVKF